MNIIQFERHVFSRDNTPSGRIVRVLLHIDHDSGMMTIGEPYDPYQSMVFTNSGKDIACGPFTGHPEDVEVFVSVYREALEFGKKRLDEVREALPQL